MNYQEKVTTRAEVRALYERVKADPAIARYRGYTAAKSYGWDEAAGDYIKRDGEAWFENPGYLPDAEKADDALTDEPLEDAEDLAAALEIERDEAVRQNKLLRDEKAELCLLVESQNARIAALESDLAAKGEEAERAAREREALAATLAAVRDLCGETPAQAAEATDA